jgi:hypothetical protein
MQAWQQTQVINEDSAFHGWAGVVVRVEKDADTEVARVFVRMDNDESVQAFDATELRILG